MIDQRCGTVGDAEISESFMYPMVCKNFIPVSLSEGTQKYMSGVFLRTFLSTNPRSWRPIPRRRMSGRTKRNRT